MTSYGVRYLGHHRNIFNKSLFSQHGWSTTNRAKFASRERKSQDFPYVTWVEQCEHYFHSMSIDPPIPGMRPSQWCHNGRDGISNHQPHDCLLNCLFRCRSKETSKLCVTGLCAGNSLVTSEFPAQMTSNAENISIWWRQHGYFKIWPWESKVKSMGRVKVQHHIAGPTSYWL